LGLDDFGVRLAKYLHDVKRANTEPAKAHLFLELVRGTFKDVNVDCAESLFPDLERYVRYRRGAVVVRGRIDAFLGNLIVEFERDLDVRLEEAREQLKKYVAILWSREGRARVNYVTMASDGVKFRVYRPRTHIELEEPLEQDDIYLDEIDRMDLLKVGFRDAYLWFDRYLLTPVLKPVSTDEFVREFGSQSPAFKSFMKEVGELWVGVKEGEEVRTLYEEWAKYLRIVYGAPVESEELFFRHTYLATLAKLMAYMSFSGGALPSHDEVLKVLRGEAFREWSILNLFEEDYFSWLARGVARERGLRLSMALLGHLSRYDIRTLDEDVMKGLYQELVDPAERHDLGEYYTPDWVAEYILEDLLKENPRARVLDPACGSGTFLFTALRLKRELIKDMEPPELLGHVVGSVTGIDVHPLAVIVSKANYLLALGNLISARKESINVPVYLADSIRLPEVKEPEVAKGIPVPRYEFDAKGEKIRIPAPLMNELPDMPVDITLDYMRSYAESAAGGGLKPSMESFRNGLFMWVPPIRRLAEKHGEVIIGVLYQSTLDLAELIRSNRDTIWPFIIKNNYKPLFLKGGFDFIVGNPPWLSYRYVADPEYQGFLKGLITETYKLTSKAELITHMELATLFFVRATELYLKDQGVIYFVMPRSVYAADQHDGFREGPSTVGLKKFVDLRDVGPLFNVPACLVRGVRGEKTTYPVKEAVVISGKLPKKNAKLEEISNLLTVRQATIHFNQVGVRSWLSEQKFTLAKERSPYYGGFSQGASIVPRPCWFVDVVPHPRFGISQQRPYLKTSQRAEKMAKRGYESLLIEGNVEADFLYGVLTSTELIPFGYLPLRVAVLPIEPRNKNYRIIDAEEAERNGFLGLTEWLRKCEREWQTRRGAKARKLSLYERLDYQKDLTEQSTTTRFRVAYPKSATYLVSSVIDLQQESLTVEVGNILIPLKGLIIDHINYFCDVSDGDEAYYLCSILNSRIIDELIKPMQAEGQFGPRDIHKKPLELPIPKFDPSNPNHRELSELGKKATEIVSHKLSKVLEKYRVEILTPQHVARIRGEVRALISDLLDEIDELSTRILETAAPTGLDRFSGEDNLRLHMASKIR